jgi:hypothetical protein
LNDGRVLHKKWKGSPVFACALAQAPTADVLLRGFGAAVEKSAALLPVSAQPSPFLMSARVALGAGAGAVSEQLADVP